MDDSSLALNPPRFVKFRKKPPIRLYRSPSRVWPMPAINGRENVISPSSMLSARDIAGMMCVAVPFGVPIGQFAIASVASTRGYASSMPRLLSPSSTTGVLCSRTVEVGADRAERVEVRVVRRPTVSVVDDHAVRVAEPTGVRAGDTVGYIGSPAKGDFKRLHFELWQSDRSRVFVPVDPRPHFAEWKLVQNYDQFTPAPPAAQREAA